MLIAPDLKIIRCSLFIESEKTLILSDLHIGQDEAMNAKGLLMPRFQYNDLFEETQKLIKETKPKKVILNGDVKHEFSGILREEWLRIQEYITFLKKKCEVVIVKGNHDSILKPLTDKLEVELKDYERVGNTFICHGDRLFDNKDFDECDTIIIGHEHPAVTLTRGPRKEKYKCFLKGEYERNKTLIIMPAMNSLSEGTDVLVEKALSPFLNPNTKNKTTKNANKTTNNKNNNDKTNYSTNNMPNILTRILNSIPNAINSNNKTNLSKFRVIIVEGKDVYDFGELGDLE